MDVSGSFEILAFYVGRIAVRSSFRNWSLMYKPVYKYVFEEFEKYRKTKRDRNLLKKQRLISNWFNTDVPRLKF